MAAEMRHRVHTSSGMSSGHSRPNRNSLRSCRLRNGSAQCQRSHWVKAALMAVETAVEMAGGMAAVRGLRLPSNSGQQLLPSRKPVSNSACIGIQHCMHGPQRSACKGGSSCSCNGHSTSSTARKCLRLTPCLQQCSRHNLDIWGNPPPLRACTGRCPLSGERRIPR